MTTLAPPTEAEVKELAGLIRECRFRYRTTPSVPVLRLCDAAEALCDAYLAQREALKLAEGLTLMHKIEPDEDPESFADMTGFDAIDCKACLFNVARGKADRRDPEKVSALSAAPLEDKP